MLLVFLRTLRESFINFWRNGWLSIAAVSVLTLSLFVVGSLFLITETADNILKNIEEKINVSVYFRTDALPEEIKTIQSELEKYSEVAKVDYISKDQALEDFKKSNADQPEIIESLKEIGGNPLMDSLVIKATNTKNYDLIFKFVSESNFKDKVSRINYSKNKEVITKLNAILSEIRRVGAGLAVLFSLISFLIIFNTIRIAIYTHKQEIEVERLVGASNTYIRLPFIFEGMMYGLVASILTMLFLFIAVKLLSPYAQVAIRSQNIVTIYQSNFWKLFGIQLGTGALLGVLSSWIAIQKYLKI